MSKQTLWVSFVSAVIISLPHTTVPITVEKIPDPRIYGGWVTDRANILNPKTERQLNQIIAELEAKTGSEIAVVTVPQTKPTTTPKEFATELFNYWKIGKLGKDNGVLFLISKADRRVEIETGYGLEAILPNGRVSTIIQKEIIPQFKQGKFNSGTIAGTKALEAILSTETTTTSPKVIQTSDYNEPVVIQPSNYNEPVVNNQPSSNSNLWGLISIIAFIGGTALLVYASYPRKNFIKPKG